MKLQKKNFLFVLAALATALTVAFVPQTALQTHAEDGVASMTEGTTVLEKDSNTKDAATVSFGGKDWRVIGYDGSGVASEMGDMTLLAAGNVTTGVFADDKGKNTYEGSKLQISIDTIANGIPAGEQAAVKPRTLASGPYNGANTDCVAGSEVVNALLWPLSTKEANAVVKELRIVDSDSTHNDWIINHWWLRSPGTGNFAAYVLPNGTVKYSGQSISKSDVGIRPAFHLNLDSVLMTSTAEGGKSSGDVGKDALSKVSKTSDNQWKLTLLDSERKDFDASLKNHADGSVEVAYTGAKTGDNEYISAIIKDSKGDITYYGRIKRCSSSQDDAAGRVTINIKDKFSDGDSLYVFNEQYNGDKQTDFSSSFIKMVSYDVTFKVKNGAWNDGTTEDKVVTLFRFEDENQDLKLKDDDIPTVGDKPNSNYKAGSWDKTPDTETTISENLTYTYTYAEEEKPVDSTPGSTDNPGNNNQASTQKQGQTQKTDISAISKIRGTLLSKMTSKGKKRLVLTWNKINGAEGYDVFFGKDGKKAPKMAKTIEGNMTFRWTKKNLKTRKAYRALVKAYVIENGKKTYVRTSPVVCAYTSGGTKTFTNPKKVTVTKASISLKVGKSSRIKAKVTGLKKGRKLVKAARISKLRYISSDKKIVTVSKTGRIKAKAKGTCKVYVIAVNGAKKAVTVKVK